MSLGERLRGLFGRDQVSRRVHAEREAPFVVFLIGMRINRLHRPDRWLPIFLAAPRMVRELERDPDTGLLGSRTAMFSPRQFAFVQYWNSFEALRAYARDAERRHFPAWVDYNRDHDGSVGIWHETYRVDPDDYETVYNEMPPVGLGAAAGSDLMAAEGERESAAGRLGLTDGSDAAVSSE